MKHKHIELKSNNCYLKFALKMRVLNFLFKIIDFRNFLRRTYTRIVKYPYWYLRKHFRKFYLKFLLKILPKEKFEQIMDKSWKKRGII